MAVKPNVILINCDDLGYGDLGCYGSRVNQTPMIDRLASEGMRFTDFHQSSPVCSASRAAMLTGCYHRRIRFPGVLFPGDPQGLHPAERTIANVLKDEGYATKIVGKWHCGDQPAFLPNRFGFDEYFGIPYSNDMGRRSWTHPKTGEKRPPLPLMRGTEVVQEQPDQTSLTERYVDESLRFIRENADKPFFLYFAHMYVHLPLYVPEAFAKRSRNGRYGAAVECIDWAWGMLDFVLKKLGLWDRTLVLFTSDNGSRANGEGGSNAPLRGTKCSSWEGGFRTPLLVRWPGKIPANVTNDHLIASMDLLPTLASLTKARRPPDKPIDGKDCAAMFTSPDAKAPRETFAYYHFGTLEALRKGKWKLFFHRSPCFVVDDPGDGEVRELYDLDADPGETDNVYDRYPDVVADLTAEADAIRKDLGDDRLGLEGCGRRPVGRVADPKPLTAYDENHPYVYAEYDLAESG